MTQIGIHAIHQKLLPAAAASVSAARRFTEDALWAAGVTGSLAEDIRLCVSELATNAIRHGTRPGCCILLRLDVAGGLVRIEVHDSRNDRPQPQLAAASDTAGRGLVLVTACADRWGSEPRAPLGKIVWAEFATP